MPSAPERKPPRVFISHMRAELDDARRLAAVLSDLGYESQLDPTPGGLISKSVMEALESADIVVALLGAGSPRPNVVFELGVATGLGKPALVVDQTGSAPPFDLAEIQVVRADATNRYALRLALERALSAGPDVQVEEDPSRHSRALGAAAESLLERARSASTEAQAVELLAEALTQSHVTAAEARFQGPGPDYRWHRPDLAAWIEESRQSLGNPIIIEVTTSPTRERIEKIRTYMELAQARTGLAVWLDDSLPASTVLWVDERGSKVLGAALVWLIEQMRVQPIAVILQRLAES